MVTRFLHTNDFHGKLDAAREARIASERDWADFYFDTGDAIQAGNLSIPLREEEVWARLARLRCTASVIGNRETHVLESGFAAKLKGAGHPVLCANLRKKDGTRPLPGFLELEAQGVRVGILAVSVPMVTDRMKTKALSAYLWDQPLEVAASLAAELRPRCDLLVALTHIGLRNDEKLASMGAVDIIFGGHSHDVLEQPMLVGSTWIAQGGSHGRFLGKYEWDGSRLAGGLVALS